MSERAGCRLTFVAQVGVIQAVLNETAPPSSQSRRPDQREDGMCKFTLLRVTVLLSPITQISCVYSEYPLTDPETCTFDERLVGQWKKVTKDRTEFVFIGRPRDIKNRPVGMMVLNDTSISSKHELFWNPTATYFFATKIGDDEYLQTSGFRASTPMNQTGKR
jgi:hypothetical protein